MLTLEKIKELNFYLQDFTNTKNENEHLFGVWQGFKICYEVCMDRDPSKLEVEFPEKWDWERREDVETEEK
jgi:hypothetical protein